MRSASLAGCALLMAGTASAGCYDPTTKAALGTAAFGTCAPKCAEACMRLHDSSFYGYHQNSFTDTTLGTCVSKVGVGGGLAEEKAADGATTMQCTGNALFAKGTFSDSDHWNTNGKYYIGWCDDNRGTGKRSAEQSNGLRTVPSTKVKAKVTKGKRGACGVVQKLTFPAGNM